jgi:hypothetical protein
VPPSSGPTSPDTPWPRRRTPSLPGDRSIADGRSQLVEFRRVEDAESSSALTVGLPDDGVLIAQDLRQGRLVPVLVEQSA